MNRMDEGPAGKELRLFSGNIRLSGKSCQLTSVLGVMSPGVCIKGTLGHAFW